MKNEKPSILDALMGPIEEPPPDATELEACVQRMKAASHEFYKAAVKTGCHPFIEFTGFMNEYIKLAEKAARAGIDFRNLNTHSGKALPMETFEASYVAEKFDCIFGPSLRSDPEIYKAFDKKLRTES